MTEQVLFSIPLRKLEPIFKSWLKEALQGLQVPLTSTPNEPQDKLLTIQEAAEFLSLSVPTLYSKVSKSELPVMKRSKRLYFSQQELFSYLKEGRQKTNAEIEAEAEGYLTKKRR